MADIDLWVCDALRAALASDIKVGVTEPAGASRFVQVRYDGGSDYRDIWGGTVLRERGRLTLNVYDTRLDTVKSLADSVQIALTAAVQNTGVVIRCSKAFGWVRTSEIDQTLSHLVAGFDLIVRR